MLLWDFHYRDVDKLWLGKALFLYDYFKYGTWLILANNCDIFFLSSKAQDSVVQTIHHKPILSLCLKTWRKKQTSPHLSFQKYRCHAVGCYIYIIYSHIYIHTYRHIISSTPPKAEDIKRHYLVALKITQISSHTRLLHPYFSCFLYLFRLCSLLSEFFNLLLFWVFSSPFSRGYQPTSLSVSGMSRTQQKTAWCIFPLSSYCCYHKMNTALVPH